MSDPAAARSLAARFYKNGICLHERVVCIDAPQEKGTVVRCDEHGVDVVWDDGKFGELVWDDTVAYNAYRLQVIRSLAAPREPVRPGWSKWYADARAEMVFRYALRRIPVDFYKQQYALGDSPQQAAKNIYNWMQATGHPRAR